MQLDPYEVLGVRYDADFVEIKNAYHRELLKWHPDKCKLENSAEKYMQIRTSWETLKNCDKLTFNGDIPAKYEIIPLPEFTLTSGTYLKSCRCGYRLEVISKCCCSSLNS